MMSEILAIVNFERDWAHCKANAKPTKRPASSSTRSETTSRPSPDFREGLHLGEPEPSIWPEIDAGEEASLPFEDMPRRLGGLDSISD